MATTTVVPPPAGWPLPFARRNARKRIVIGAFAKWRENLTQNTGRLETVWLILALSPAPAQCPGLPGGGVAFNRFFYQNCFSQ